jgi:hypothetical protein
MPPPVPGTVVGASAQVGPGGDTGSTAATPVADATQNGLLRQVSGNATDYVDATNNSRPLSNIISIDVGNALAIGADNRIKAGGPTSHYYDYDDLLNVFGVTTGGSGASASKLLSMNNSGAAGASNGASTGDWGDGHHGVIALLPGTVAQAWARAYIPSPIYLKASTFTWRMWVCPFNAPAAAASQHLIGFTSAPSTAIAVTNYYIMFYLIPASAANWHAYVRSAAAVTDQDTGVNGMTHAWFDLKIVATATQVKFYINGNLTNTITTNIPSTTQLLYPAVWINASTDTANYSFYVDYAEIDIDTGIAGRFSRSPI